MDKKVIGRENTSSTVCELQEDGFWKVTQIVIERVLYEGKDEWVEERVETMSIDRNIEAAMQTALASSLNFLFQNVYDNGYKSLVEYREDERKLKAN